MSEPAAVVTERRPSVGVMLGLGSAGERRGSLTKVKSVFSSIRRASLTKSKSPPTSPDAATASKPTLSPSQESVESLATTTEDDSASECSSVHKATIHLLNSQSPASELPQTWGQWNAAYANGFIDFNDPPPPPSDLFGTDFATSTGQHRAPVPLSERRRQRAVDNIQIINRASNKRDSLESPKSLGPKPTATGPIPISPLSATFSESSSSAESDASSTSASSVASSSAPKPTASSHYTVNTPLAGVLPKEQATHPALLKLAQDARVKFGVAGGTVSLMDGDAQVFLAQEGFIDLPSVPRENTICSHTMLRAAATGQKDPLVVLDIGNDWRFGSNDFGDFGGGFYAAAPIMVPAPLGEEGLQPAGIFCLIDQKPRQSFSDEERAVLEEMADLAGAEIVRWQKEQEAKRKVVLTKKREAWKRSKLVRRVSAKSSLDTVTEVLTPPASPDCGIVQDVTEHFGGLHTALESRRPSLAESTGSASSGELSLKVEEHNPTFGRRSSTAALQTGTPATIAKNIPSDVKAVLDLSVKLVAESLDLDFVYLAEVSLDQFATSAKHDTTQPTIKLLASHNAPIPLPLFDIGLHRETLTSSHKALLYTDPNFSGADGEFSSGLLLKVVIGFDGAGYVLGAFTEDPRRVINVDDLAFCRTFAKDLAGWVTKL